MVLTSSLLAEQNFSEVLEGRRVNTIRTLIESTEEFRNGILACMDF